MSRQTTATTIIEDEGPFRKGEQVKAILIRVIDGDTFVVAYPPILEIGVHKATVIRLHGCDAPEMKTTAGKAVSEWLRLYLNRHKDEIMIMPMAWNVYRGRVDCKVWVGGRCLADYMVEKQIAKRTNGRARHEWTAEELNEFTLRAQTLLLALE